MLPRLLWGQIADGLSVVVGTRAELNSNVQNHPHRADCVVECPRAEILAKSFHPFLAVMLADFPDFCFFEIRP